MALENLRKKEVKKYNFAKIEKKWQKIWSKQKTHQPNLDKAKSPFYNLMMFPYPSAEGLHAGNMYAFTGADVYGRFQRMQGKDVFEPIGLDGFGIHSENYALKIGTHPLKLSKISEKRYYKQLESIGNGYAWDSKVETYDPEYYKWTQWLFLQLFKKGLAYKKKASVNWCPKCLTVLADEQVIGGECERCGSVVEKKDLEQWFFKITDYAERLLSNIDRLDWSEKIKIAQRNWIGKSMDTEIDFDIRGTDEKLRIVTTRPDTIFGATFLVVAPEHQLVDALKQRIQNWNEIEMYRKTSIKENDYERGLDSKKKTGVLLHGVVGINPVNDLEIPILLSDYVLAGYGTGAIMGVPGHDDRDNAFAKAFKLPTLTVIERTKEADGLFIFLYDYDQSDLAGKLRKTGVSAEYWTPTQRKYNFKISDVEQVVGLLQNSQIGAVGDYDQIRGGHSFALEVEPVSINFTTVYSGDGIHVNSGFLNGLSNEEAIDKMHKWLEENERGGESTHYHLRDWLISRQRYWGPPIPVIYCRRCWENSKSQFPNSKEGQDFVLIDNLEHKIIAVPEEDLPVKLPNVKNFRPTGTGHSPLASVESFVKVKCPVCKSSARRETDVSDTFLDSSWYFFRYLDNKNKNKPFDKHRAEKWLPIDMYIGGAEHSVLHLLYTRFITMVMKDIGLTEFDEPFKKFRAHGLIIKDGAKMSKSKGNVINPDEYIKRFGADVLRTYLMFLAPFEQGGDFQDGGIVGVVRFLERTWKMGTRIRNGPARMTGFIRSGGELGIKNNANLEKIIHKTIKKVTEDIGNLSYNTAISSLMILLNALEDEEEIDKETFGVFVKLLNPFAPHISHELWEVLGNKGTLDKEEWPKYDADKIVDSHVNIAVQVNGKTRAMLEVASGITEESVQNEALNMPEIKKWLEGNSVKKVIYVKGRIINIVV